MAAKKKAAKKKTVTKKVAKKRRARKKVAKKAKTRTKDVGRPTDYGEDILAIARDYLKHHHEVYGDRVPMNEGLMLALNISSSTFYRWIGEEDKAEFKEIIEAIKRKQHNTLINKGLGDEHNASITKLILVSKHGYSDKVDTTVANPDGTPVKSGEISLASARKIAFALMKAARGAKASDSNSNSNDKGD